MPFKDVPLNFVFFITWLEKMQKTLFFYRTKVLDKPYYPTLSKHFDAILQNLYLLTEELKIIKNHENLQQTNSDREEYPF